MHLTIAQLVTDAHDIRHYDEDTVLEDMQGRSTVDSVEEHDGEQHEDRVREIIEWFGDAAKSKVEKIGDSHYVTSMTLDKEKLKGLFLKYYESWLADIRKLCACTLDDFANHSGPAADGMYRINDEYKFDWLYVLDEYGNATPISEWLRYALGDEEPKYQKYYIGPTYSGHQ